MAGQYFYDPRPFYGHNSLTGLMPLDELFYGRYDPVVPYWMDQRMMFDDSFYKQQQMASRRGGPEVMQQQYLPQRGENNFMPYKRPELVRDDMYTDMYTRRSPYNFNYSNYGRDGFAVSAPGMQFRGQQSQDDTWVHAMSAPPAPYGYGQGYRGLPEPPPGGMSNRALTNSSGGIDQYHQSNQGGEQYRQMETPANTRLMSNQNNMASNMMSNMSNRETHGNSHGSKQGNSHGNSHGNSTHGNNHGSSHGNSQGSNQGNSHGNNQGSNQGNSHGNSQGSNQGNSHGNGHGNNHGSSHGNSHGSNQGNSHSNSHGNNHSNSHGNNHGINQGNSQGNNHSNSHGNNHGNSQGSLGTKQVGFSGTQTGGFGTSVGKSSSMQTSSKQTTISNTKRYDSSSSSDSDDDDDQRRGHNNGSNKWAGTVVKSTHGHGGKVSSGHGHHSSSYGYESNSRGLKKSSSHSKKSSSHGHGGQSKISRLLGFGDDSSSSEDESYGHGGGKGSSKGSSLKGSANQHGGHVASFQQNYGSQPKQMQFSSQSKSVELKVPICCDNCERKVRSCLEKMHGVESVLCDQWNRKVIVYGNLKADDVLKRVRRVKKTSELWSLAKQQQQQQQQMVRVY